MANVLKQQEKQEVGYFHIFNRKYTAQSIYNLLFLSKL